MTDPLCAGWHPSLPSILSARRPPAPQFQLADTSVHRIEQQAALGTGATQWGGSRIARSAVGVDPSAGPSSCRTLCMPKAFPRSSLCHLCCPSFPRFTGARPPQSVQTLVSLVGSPAPDRPPGARKEAAQSLDAGSAIGSSQREPLRRRGGCTRCRHGDGLECSSAGRLPVPAAQEAPAAQEEAVC